MQRAVRGRLVSFAGDPAESEDAVRYWSDGLVAIDGGRIVAVGDAQAISPFASGAPAKPSALNTAAGTRALLRKKAVEGISANARVM